MYLLKKKKKKDGECSTSDQQSQQITGEYKKISSSSATQIQNFNTQNQLSNLSNSINNFLNYLQQNQEQHMKVIEHQNYLMEQLLQENRESRLFLQDLVKQNVRSTSPEPKKKKRKTKKNE